MAALEQGLDPQWGFTKKGESEYRPLTAEEHELLMELRTQETDYLGGIARHTQALVGRRETQDPTVNGEEMIVIVFNGVQANIEVFDHIPYDDVVSKFHFGSPFKDGWVVTVNDAFELRERFADRFHFLSDADVLAQVNRKVSPHSFDPANIYPLD